MTAEVIVFDKDGTLIDFDAFWVTVSVFAIKEILKSVGREDIAVEELLCALGVKNGSADVEGILCKGTYEQIGMAVYGILKNHGCDISPEDMSKRVIDAFNKNADAGEIKPTCENIREVLGNLKKGGRKLLVVTTDNYEITHKCLTAMGIEDMFDRIYTDDGKTPVKPNPWCIEDFCKAECVKPDKIVMVGDTMTDVNFARNAGIRVIGVGKNEKNRHRLEGYADAVVEDISHVFEIIGEAK